MRVCWIERACLSIEPEDTRIVRQLPDVRVVLPMHYQTDLTASWPIAPVEAFLRTMDNVHHIRSSDVVLTRAAQPETVEVWVQNHA